MSAGKQPCVMDNFDEFLELDVDLSNSYPESDLESVSDDEFFRSTDPSEEPIVEQRESRPRPSPDEERGQVLSPSGDGNNLGPI